MRNLAYIDAESIGDTMSGRKSKRKEKRYLFCRFQGGAKRYYADLRGYADVGGGRIALIARGEKLATTDETTAIFLATEKIKEFEGARRGRNVHGIVKSATLREYAPLHLIAKKSSDVTVTWLETAEMHLKRAIDFMGDKDLSAIKVEDVRGWIEWLRKIPNGRGKMLGGGTIKHHINTLSNLYKRAQGEGYVIPGYNPVAALMEKPRAERKEAAWLEVHLAALYLEAARLYKVKRADIAMHFAYPLIATFLLTGGRMDEVLGLEIGDVDLERKKITFRPNTWRRLKTSTSHRSVPIWPQLHTILKAYLNGENAPSGRLLFPSYRTGEETMLTDIRKILDAVGISGGWKEEEIRTKIFRHTYTAARLQTLDNGHPVGPDTVGRELGHGSHSMVRKVYGHLGEVRHRSNSVEFRIEQYAEHKDIKDRLKVLYESNNLNYQSLLGVLQFPQAS